MYQQTFREASYKKPYVINGCIYKDFNPSETQTQSQETEKSLLTHLDLVEEQKHHEKY